MLVIVFMLSCCMPPGVLRLSGKSRTHPQCEESQGMLRSILPSQVYLMVFTYPSLPSFTKATHASRFVYCSQFSLLIYGLHSIEQVLTLYIIVSGRCFGDQLAPWKSGSFLHHPSTGKNQTEPYVLRFNGSLLFGHFLSYNSSETGMPRLML